MSHYSTNKHASTSLLATALLPALLLVASVASFALPQQSSSNPSSPATSSTANAAGAQGTRQGAGTQSGAGVQTVKGAQGTEALITNQPAGSTTNQPTADDPIGATTTRAQAAIENRAAMQQNLNAMGSRLDALMAAMSSATGAQRDTAMAVVLQEMAAQLADMRRLLLANGSGTLDNLAGDQAPVFITPSSAAEMAESRRQGEIGETTAGTSAQATSRGAESAAGSTSSLAAQAESRRRGEGAEVVEPDGQ